MDLAYWGFRSWPFDRSSPAARNFISQAEEEAMSRLLFLVEEFRRCGVIIGPAGTGKTLLLKSLESQAERLARVVVRCDAMGQDCNDLLSQVALALHAVRDANASTATVWNSLKTKFAALALVRQPLVLLIDHLTTTDPGGALAVRRLDQLANLTGLKLTMALVLSEEEIPAGLREMIDLRIDLAHWTLSETHQFIRWATMGAGSTKPLFADSAMTAIHRITQGVPVRVVSVCNLCLLAAQARDESFVTSEIAEAVADEWNRIPHSATSTKRGLSSASTPRAFGHPNGFSGASHGRPMTARRA
jgi:general secretion pathway protein A